jgi:hypothetical protein
MAENRNASPVVTRGAPPHGRTGAQRQARYRTRQREIGCIEITIIIPADAAADCRFIAEAMRAHPHLRPGPLRDPVSGKLVAAKRALAEGRK